MFKNKKFIAALAVIGVMGLTNIAQAASPLTGNIGFTSNYIWRGVSQTGDESAISGGLDFSTDVGLYVGTWVSSLGGGGQYEHDLYVGYGFNAGDFGLDVGYIQYMYPVGPAQDDFSEIYINANWQKLIFGAALTLSSDDDTTPEFSDGDIYLYVGYDIEIKKGLTLSLLYGDYDFDNITGEDYSHFHIALSKDEFTFALDKNDKTDTGNGEDDIRLSVSYTKTIDM